MTTKPKIPTTDELVKAIAKANGHPDPDAFAAEVAKHLEDGDDV